jgi:DNA-binding CsgD family transcriptional regulator
VSPVFSEEDYLAHYGILRKSGRYPWGSGETQSQRNRDFLTMVDDLKKKGLSDTEISRGLGIESTTAFRAAKSIAKNQQKADQIAQAQKLKDHGYSNVRIGEMMGINESSVRSLLAPGQADKTKVLNSTADMLKRQVDAKGYLDIGTGVEYHAGVSRTKLDAAVAVLREQGYAVHKVQVDQLGTGNKTTIKVLAPPGTEYRDIAANKDKISSIAEYSNDGGRSFLGVQPPISVSSKRLAVRYAEQGGTEADGVIFVRPGVEDLSLGRARYAQVRVAVDGTHYLKGMAIYKDDLPAGVDLMFNTNKSDTGNKLDALKPMKDDPENPFGSVVRQLTYPPGHPKADQLYSAMNIVNEEGDWDNWSRSFSTQMLSKQTPALARQQLGITYDSRKADLDEIRSLTNPAVRKKLLDAYADGADSAAVHLKAAAIPRTQNHVILPISSLKPSEIYAPNFNDGDRVALIRYPHGGIFEIPELTVNNRNRAAKNIIGTQAKDAVGIHHTVAAKLSGADFDGDTVLVIPNNRGLIKSAPSLKDLEGFDPQRLYKLPDDAPKMSSRTKGMQMGLVSNLITDMTIKGASNEELARAVKHSMVVIDAEKHHLDYQRSARDNGIAALMKKYQGRSQGGAATLISRATSPVHVRARKRLPRIDPATGKKIWIETGESYVDRRTGKTVFRTQESQKLKETDDARTLLSEGGGTPMEMVYATHSNKLKALANEARRESASIRAQPRSPSAAVAYAPQVESLTAKLNLAMRNRPLERQAQVLANAVVQQKRAANPDMEAEEIKKLNGQALREARRRTGADKQQIKIEPDEWEAIQAGAITNNRLNDILDNADLDQVRQLAMPRTQLAMTPTNISRAKSMSDLGYTQAEIAEQLGVSVTTLKAAL